MEMKQIKPGMFSVSVAADLRRLEFDSKNGELMQLGIHPFAVMIGDSITHAWELGAYFDSGQGLMINRGIGGDIPYYVEKRFAADALQLKPQWVVVLCGINETWTLGSCENEAEMRKEKNAAERRILTPLNKIVCACVEAGQKLALCSILPVFGTDCSEVPIRKQLIWEVNGRIRKLCAGSGAVYVDYFTKLADTDGKTLRRELSEDGCHPNADGYSVMAEVLVAAMNGQACESVTATASQTDESVIRLRGKERYEKY